ncbi:MAG: dienelactone hydrolase family protein [Lacipirellulaceae bacterium]
MTTATRIAPLLAAALAMTLVPLLSLADDVASPAPAPQEVDLRVTPDVLAAFAPHELAGEAGGLALPYRLLAPPSVAPGERYPLLVVLHGFGERGDDNWRQLIHGGRVLADPAFRARHRAFVVCPQCPEGNEPGTQSREPGAKPGDESPRCWTWRLERGAPSVIDVAAEPTPQLAAVRRLVAKLCDELPIDRKRLYVGGLSMGGYATWELVTRDPELYAAAMPICGGGDPTRAARLASTPIWAMHGDADLVIPVERSREMVAAVNGAGGAAILTEYPGVDHDSWTPTFASRHAWDWLFAQRRSAP